jgi:type II secretory pathway component PulF
MARYQYRAKNKEAQTIVGQILAESKEDAVEKINQLGLVPVSIEEGTAEFKKRTVRAHGITVKEIYLFSHQLASLLKAGVPILRALETIASQVRDPYFQGVIASISLGIRGGKSFSDCLLEYPNIFSLLYATMIKAGEESGRLRESVVAMAEYLRTQNELMAKVRMAVIYPSLMMLFGLGTVIFILTYVMPQITRLFVDLKQTLPLPTVVVMAISGFLVKYWTVSALALLIIIGMLKKWASSFAGQVALSHLTLRIPGVGSFWLKVEMARFCRTLELLLQSNVTLIRAMQLSIPIVKNESIREQLTKCQEDILSGRSFGASLKERHVIPPLIGEIVTVGEESGLLWETFHEIANDYEQQTSESVKVMATLLEPLMIVVVGSMVGFIVLAMLLPIFQLDVFAR